MRIYRLDANDQWVQVGADIDGEADFDESGYSVSLSGDGQTVAIGAPYNQGNGSYVGHVRIYRLDANDQWAQVGADIDGEADYDESGYSVSLSGDGQTVAIGAPYNQGNGDYSGHVRIYQLDASDQWIQVGADIDGEVAGDESGRSVSLSDDGRTVAIGATWNDGNGDSSGHVRIFQLDANDQWVQVGADIDGEADYDEFGYSVTLSGDGETVAIGAPFNDGSGDNSGHVRI